jgi:hypothetical protein
MPPIIHQNHNLPDMRPNITFEWRMPLPPEFDGISVLVNDVERYRGFVDNDVGRFGSFTWQRRVDAMPEYFRFGYMAGAEAGDYTMAGTWHEDGSWTHMKHGPS